MWFILDELATLQRLPQLHTAITENRKSNNPVVLGFQGRSQLETRYGHDAEAMLSQPATKIFLGTSEAARGQVDLGDDRRDRDRAAAREPVERGLGRIRPSTSYGLERQVEPLVMASEITGLAPLRGYLKLGNLVVRLSGSLRGPAGPPAGVHRTAAPTTRASDGAPTVADRRHPGRDRRDPSARPGCACGDRARPPADPALERFWR